MNWGILSLDMARHLDEKIEKMVSDSTEEGIADAFARHLLMPKRAVLRGVTRLGTTPKLAGPRQYYAVASWLGVGYSTLIQHTRWTLQLIDSVQLHQLTLKTPQQIKRGAGTFCFVGGEKGALATSSLVARNECSPTKG
jgi:hypothetical protein